MKTRRTARSQGKRVQNKFFGLTREDMRGRSILRTAALLAGVFTLVVLIAGVVYSESPESREKSWSVLFCFINYAAPIIAAYFLARNLAAKYLDDLYELKDLKQTNAFLEDISFGNGETQVTIKDGSIPENEEKSPLHTIGGPGEVMVHLGNAAISETADGTPRVIMTRSQAWEMEGFERIREISQFEEVAKREYAIINLRDQFIRGLSLRTRTKDSILVDIKGIKVMFSILRDSRNSNGKHNGGNPFTFDESALRSLVYNQAVLTKASDTEKDSSHRFPWDTTIIPLVIGELEKLIQTRTLNEILTSIGQKEKKDIEAREKELEQNKEGPGSDVDVEAEENASPQSTFIPRAEITEIFFSEEFQQRAANLGISIGWIDVGTWEIEQSFVLDNLKIAREKTHENEKYEKAIEKNEIKLVFDKTLELIKKVVVSNFKQSIETPVLSPQEWNKLAETIRKNPELADPYLVRQLYRQMVNEKTSQLQAMNMIKAFNSELLAAREIITQEATSPAEKTEALRKINNALKCINQYIYHMVGAK